MIRRRDLGLVSGSRLRFAGVWHGLGLAFLI